MTFDYDKIDRKNMEEIAKQMGRPHVPRPEFVKPRYEEPERSWFRRLLDWLDRVTP